METWRVVSWAPLYEVSSLGNVRSRKTGHAMKVNFDKPSPRVGIVVHGVLEYARVVTMVVDAFIGPGAGVLVFADGNQKNCSADNVTWGQRRGPKPHIRPARPSKLTDAQRRECLVYFKGEYKTMADWARVIGISAKILSERILSGMTSEQAFSLPTQKPHAYREVHGLRNSMAAVYDRIASECGVTRQAIEQTEGRARGRYQRALIADRCIAWRGPAGERLTDDEIAELLACVTAEPDLKRQLFESDLEVGPLCKAMLKMSRGRTNEAASCEMLCA